MLIICFWKQIQRYLTRGRKKTSLNFNTKNNETRLRPAVAEDKTPRSQCGDTERETLALTLRK